jgi:hypothetical protein
MSGHIVESDIWSCKEFLQVSSHAKLVWFALKTNPFRKRIPGIQIMVPGIMAEIVGITKAEAETALTSLVDAGLLDIEDMVVRMPSAPKVEATTCRNPSVLLRWWADFRELPRCDAVFAHIESIAEALPLYRATDNFKAVWWGTFGSTYANWYRLTTGHRPPEWATRPSSWDGYCESKGMPDITRGVEDVSETRSRFWMPSTSSPHCEPQREAAQSQRNQASESVPSEEEFALQPTSTGATQHDLSLQVDSDLLSVFEIEKREKIRTTSQIGRERITQRSDSLLERRPKSSGDGHGRRETTTTSLISISDAHRRNRASVQVSDSGIIRERVRPGTSSRSSLSAICASVTDDDWIDNLFDCTG